MSTAIAIRVGEECGALYDNTHVVLVSGLHSDGYFNGAKILRHPGPSFMIACGLAALFKDSEIETVVGPMNGGGIWAHDVARALDYPRGRRVITSVYATERDGKRVFDRDQVEAVEGRRAAVVDDVLTTGFTLYATIGAVMQAGGKVEVVGVICDRSGGKWELKSIPVVSLLQRDWQNYPEESCPMCKDKVPIETRVGHGAEFLRAHPELATEEQRETLGLNFARTT